MKKFVIITTAAALCGTLPAATVSAHDVTGFVHQQHLLSERSAAQEVRRALKPDALSRISRDAHVSSQVAQSVIATALVWQVPRKLSICFSSGSEALRHKVVASMRRQWPIEQLTSSRLQYGASFDSVPTCNPVPSSDIKVAFTANDGYWSYIGTDSVGNNPSMNLQSFSESSPGEPDFSRLVGHEMGHALGLEHEHQSPSAPDCKWNWDYIFTHYQWKSKQEMHDNFDKLVNSLNGDLPTYQVSPYDKASIMHYSFPSQAFDDGANDNCYIAENEVPSKEDRAALSRAYGPALLNQQKIAQQHTAKVSRALNPEFSALRRVLGKKAQLMQL